jgi:hypothetical protein
MESASWVWVCHGVLLLVVFKAVLHSRSGLLLLCKHMQLSEVAPLPQQCMVSMLLLLIATTWRRYL